MEQIQTIPKLQTVPVISAPSNVHYGYTAYQDIDLMGTLGIEHFVQPENSPYRTKLPCRQLIPFVNMTEPVPNKPSQGSLNTPIHKVEIIDEYGKVRTVDSASFLVSKTARDCVEEIARSYQGEGFVALYPLTAMDEDSAFLIFQAIQPFKYKLKDVLDQFNVYAPERIDCEEEYIAEYLGEEIIMRPLPPALREKAKQILPLLQSAAVVAVEKATEVIATTVMSMTKSFSGGVGKLTPDPLDRILFAEMDRDIPTLLTAQEEQKVASDAVVERAATAAATAIAGAMNKQPNNDEVAELRREMADMKVRLEAAEAKKAK